MGFRWKPGFLLPDPRRTLLTRPRSEPWLCPPCDFLGLACKENPLSIPERHGTGSGFPWGQMNPNDMSEERVRGSQNSEQRHGLSFYETKQHGPRWGGEGPWRLSQAVFCDADASCQLESGQLPSLESQREEVNTAPSLCRVLRRVSQRNSVL